MRSWSYGRQQGHFGRLVLRIAVLLAMVATAVLAAGNPSPASAQTIECDEQPLLGAFDANDDGVVSVAEIRQADPDDQTLQEYADELEASDVFGVFYRGCDDLNGDGSDSEVDPEGQGDAEDEEPAESEDTGVGEEESGDSTVDDDDELFVTTLPGVGDGTPPTTAAWRSWPATGAAIGASISLCLLASTAIRTRKLAA